MASLRKRLRDVFTALDAATTYSQWLAAAEEHDRLTGADAWRQDDEAASYDAATLRRDSQRLSELQQRGDPLELAAVLDEQLVRHLNDLAAPELYDTAMAGTKHLVERYLVQAAGALEFLAKNPTPEVPARERLRRFEGGWKVFGRSALMLSGGATWGFFHMGVIKALHELNLLPHTLSGASTGAMVAAGMCTRNDEELSGLFADTRQVMLEGLAPIGLKGALKAGAWLNPDALRAVLDNNVGDFTFAQAYARSGRALNISVSPTRTRQKPRLLTHLTSPDVLVVSAVMASSALPLLYPPVELQARRGGEVVPYIEGERWVDGSLSGDLPKLRMARLHNVNHFIVSQTNPHVMPFLQQSGKRGLGSAVASLATDTARVQATYATDLARRFTTRRDSTAAQLANQAYTIASQDYRGDINLNPRFRPALLRKVVSNLTHEELDQFILEGERSVWPKVVAIRNQTRIGRTFRDCVATLRATIAAG